MYDCAFIGMMHSNITDKKFDGINNCTMLYILTW